MQPRGIGRIRVFLLLAKLRLASLASVAPPVAGIRAGLAALRQPVLILGGAFLLFFVALIALPRLHAYLVRPVSAPVAGPPVAAVPEPAAETPARTPFSRETLAGRGGFRRPETPAGAIEPVDGRSFRAGERVYALAGIDAPGGQAVCRDGEGRLWACGLQARAAINNRIKEGGLACLQAARGAAAEAGFTCDVAGEDLALWLVRHGWARPAASGSMALHRAAEEARAAKSGLWNGDWTLIRGIAPAPPEAAEPDSGTAPRQGAGGN